MTGRTARWIHLAVLLFWTSTAAAANFQVAPLRLEFGAEQRALSLSLTNADTRPVVVEVKAFSWEQVDGKDQLTPTNDLVLSPPLVEVPGQAKQLIRIGRRGTVKAGAIERTYRVLVQEVVPAAETAKPGLHFSLRLSLPVFIAPKLDDELARPVANWTASAGPRGALAVALRNSGNSRLQVVSFEVLGADDRVRAAQGDMTYVLAGSTRQYMLKHPGPLPSPGTVLTIKAKTDAGDQVARVAFARP